LLHEHNLNLNGGVEAAEIGMTRTASGCIVTIVTVASE
jgi:hypothetical protein